MNGAVSFIQSRWDELLARTAEHLLLTGISTFAALVLGLGIAVIAFRCHPLRKPLLTTVSLLQTIPGLALLVMMLALLGTIGWLPAFATLVLYALLPITRNTLTGLLSLPPNLAEAAKALGLTAGQRLRYVRIPHAMPAIVAGLRVAAVQCVGLATLAAFVGAGGLGQFINRGLFLSDTRLILLGAIPAALIALLTDALIHFIQLGAFGIDASRLRRRLALFAGTLLFGAMAVFTLLFLPSHHAASRADAVTIGSKNFTEQLIIAEIVAQTIEQKTDLEVVRRFSLGGTTVMHQALRHGDIDVAVEYTGSALMAVLGEPAITDHQKTFEKVQGDYAKRFALTWFQPLGFNNSYILAVRRADPRLRNVTTLSALTAEAPQLVAGFDFEFAERSDGYAGLARHYGLHFRELRDMHPDLLFDTLAQGQVDIISATSTDGRLSGDSFKTLVDDRQFFPPYDAAIVARQDALARHPALEKTLAMLSGRFSDDTMRRLNAAVDQKRLSPAEAAALCIKENGISR